MAAGLTIDIDENQAAQLKAAADARGMTVEDFARAVLAFGLIVDDSAPDDDLDVEEDVRRADEFEQTGVGIPWEEVSAWLMSLQTDNPLPRPAPRKLR